MMVNSRSGRLAVAAFIAVSATAIAVPAFADPQLTMKGEEQGHPRLVKAIHAVREARDALEKAPEDFGGHKAKAIEDCNTAIHSLKVALYYRLKLDNEAIDKANP